MSPAALSNLPEAQRAAVARGLLAAFGTTELDSVQPVAGGLSGAGLWRIRVGGIAYLLRSRERDALRDPVRGYACMRIAAAACLAPRVRYACAATGSRSATHRAAVARPDYPGGAPPLVVELAQAVRPLHATPAFPPLVDYLDGLVADRAARALDILDAAATAELFARSGDMRPATAPAGATWSPATTTSIPATSSTTARACGWWTGTRPSWPTATWTWPRSPTGSARDAAGEERLLTTYFGRPAGAGERARFDLMRLVNHVFTGVIFLNGAAAERPAARLADRTLSGPGLAALRRRLRDGDIDLLAWENRVAYGKARLAAALEGLKDTACAEALARIAAD